MHRRSRKVSMPLIGLVAFLRVQKYLRNKLGGVSMPLIGLITFLQLIMQQKKELRYSVNALNRAYCISTVPSGNPPAARLSRLIFVCNCQNILIISFFYPFFCLFKKSILFPHHHSTISPHS